jgi:hypothetical protein
MACVSKTFHSIPLHVNPEQPENVPPVEPWLCDVSFLSSSANPSSVYAIGLDDPTLERFMFCTSLCVSVKEIVTIDPDGFDGGLALHHQRPYAMMRRQQNSSIGLFLHRLSQVVARDAPLRSHMLVDDDDDADSPSDDSALTLMLHFDINAVISPAALYAGIIVGSEEIEHISLRFEFSRTARTAHVASLALMMAAHDRLGADSLLGTMGPDILRLVCDAYRLRLYECRRNVWNLMSEGILLVFGCVSVLKQPVVSESHESGHSIRAAAVHPRAGERDAEW